MAKQHISNRDEQVKASWSEVINQYLADSADLDPQPAAKWRWL
jgi:hypothetical protein